MLCSYLYKINIVFVDVEITNLFDFPQTNGINVKNILGKYLECIKFSSDVFESTPSEE